LLEELKSRFDIREDKKQSSLQKQLKQSQKRYTEIDIILQKFYKKQLLNGISDERFQKLADNYESKQTELNQQIKVGSILEREYVLLFCLEIELGLQRTLYCFRTVNIQGKVL